MSYPANAAMGMNRLLAAQSAGRRGIRDRDYERQQAERELTMKWLLENSRQDLVGEGIDAADRRTAATVRAANERSRAAGQLGRDRLQFDRERFEQEEPVRKARIASYYRGSRRGGAGSDESERARRNLTGVNQQINETNRRVADVGVREYMWGDNADSARVMGQERRGLTSRRDSLVARRDSLAAKAQEGLLGDEEPLPLEQPEEPEAAEPEAEEPEAAELSQEEIDNAFSMVSEFPDTPTRTRLLQAAGFSPDEVQLILRSPR